MLFSHRPSRTRPAAALTAGRTLEGLENRLLFAAGDVDTSFGAGGFAGATFPGHIARASDVAIDTARGRILVSGTLDPSLTGGRTALSAFRLNGQPDTSFSGDGKLVTDLTGGAGISFLPDGRFYLAGGANRKQVVERFNRDGSLDRGFSGDGKLTLTGWGPIGFAPNGKFVQVSGSNGPLTVTRYNADGSLDKTLGGDGSVSLPYDDHDAPPGEDQRSWTDPHLVAVQGDGKILIAGNVFGPDMYDGVVARLNADGTYDTTFSGDGKQIVSTGSVDYFATALALAPGGDILVGVIEREGHAFVKRLSPDGAERPFADPGIIGEDPSGVSDISVAPDGKIVVSGDGDWFDDEHPTDWFLYRLNADGTRDASFGGTGTTHVIYPVGYRHAVDPSGNIVVARVDYNGGPAPALGVTRYCGSGGADTGEGMKLVNGTLSVTGTSRGDRIVVLESYEGFGGVIVTNNGLARNFDAAAVKKIVITSGAGNDHVYASPGGRTPVTVDAGSGDDHVVTRYGNDRLIGGPGNDFLDGGGGNDSLDGGDGDDRVSGGDGNDTLTGGAGKDQLRGNAGNDTLYASGDGSADFLDGGSGTDMARKDDNDFAQYVEQLLA